MAEGSSPSGMTQLATGSQVTVVVAEAVVARSTELGTSGAVEVSVTDGAIAIDDSRQQR